MERGLRPSVPSSEAVRILTALGRRQADRLQLVEYIIAGIECVRRDHPPREWLEDYLESSLDSLRKQLGIDHETWERMVRSREKQLHDGLEPDEEEA